MAQRDAAVDQAGMKTVKVTKLPTAAPARPVMPAVAPRPMMMRQPAPIQPTVLVARDWKKAINAAELPMAWKRYATTSSTETQLN